MSTENNKENNFDDKRKKRIIYRTLQIIFIIGLLISVIGLGKEIYTLWQEEMYYQQLQNQVNKPSTETDSNDPAGSQTDTDDESESGSETESETEPEEAKKPTLEELGIKPPEKNIDWDALAKTNEDIYAWIYIPGTYVDYPILQHPDKLSYYLKRTPERKESKYGSIYTQYLNSKDFTDPNTVIYGHKYYKTTKMFTTIHYYESLDFFEQNRYIYIYTPEKVLVYEVFAAYQGTNENILISYDFSIESSYAAYIKNIFEARDSNAHYLEGREITTADRIVTLSTCITGKDDHRYLVQGVLLNTGDLPVVEENE